MDDKTAAKLKVRAAVVGHIYNHLTSMDVSRNIFKWADTLYLNGHLIAASNVEPYQLVEIHPIHFVHMDGRMEACNQQSGRPCSEITLSTNTKFTDLFGENISVSGDSEIQLPNQCGHLIEESSNGNVVRYHFGGYALFYISTRFIQLGETIGCRPGLDREVVSAFVHQNRESMASFNKYHIGEISGFNNICNMSRDWTEHQKRSMQLLFNKIKKLNL